MAGPEQDANRAPRGGRVRPARSGRYQLVVLGLVFVLPVIAAYASYFLFQPEGQTNYGALIQPQRDVAEFALDPIPAAGGSVPPFSGFAVFSGRWVFVVAAPAACDDACQRRLYDIRQVRLTTGPERDRIERLWIVTDEGNPPAELLAAHPGLRLGRATHGELARVFPTDDGTDPAAHIYLVDPLGHLMMRFPLDADPSRIKKDILHLLKVSRIG